ncbi:hypothetical protein BDF19DRAFT_426483 [Syncephalis fuscata]|nr:hypothetical protein BDF19DRAFT_426483 [Syncephalis fuscata]
MAALMGVSLLIYRYRHVWSVETRVNSARLIRRPVDWMIVHLAWCSFARSAYTLLLAIDVIPGAAIRQLILAFTNWGYLWALAVFLAGVVEALFLVLQQTSFETNFRWCRDTNQPSSPGRGTRKFCGISLHSIMERGILMVIGLIVCVVPCTATALSYMAGQALDTENWDEYARLEQLSWLTWTAGLGCLAFLASLYLGSLSSVLRQSANLLRLSAASYDADTSQQLLWLIKLMICFYISSTLASIAHSLLFSIMLAHFYPIKIDNGRLQIHLKAISPTHCQLYGTLASPEDLPKLQHKAQECLRSIEAFFNPKFFAF